MVRNLTLAERWSLSTPPIGSSGRPQGSRNRATLAVEALLDDEAEKLTRKAIDMALAGDPTALRICMERIIPKRHERFVVIDLPEISETADAVKALSAVITATAGGELTPSEARSIGALLSAYATLHSPNGVDVGHALEAETAIPTPLPGGAISEAMAAWIAVICSSSAKSS